MKFYCSKLKICIPILLIQLSNQHLIYAQDKIEKQDSKYIIATNRIGEQLEQLNIGDLIKLKLKDSKKVNGKIDSIYSAHFKINMVNINYDEINKMRKLKKRTAQLIIGGAFLVGGISTFYILSIGNTNFDKIPLVGALGIGLTTVGITVMVPNWHKIGKSKSLHVISTSGN
ncbi:MAG: hypothetical protein O6943_03105 [Bacteroidetes bacterium]|nr:hypothetical protein [Bacteroidota bacterium]